jgi:hypothetical protein
MRFCRASFLILCCIGFFTSSHALAGQGKVATTTVCDVVKKPAAFDNKFVRFTATLTGNFEISSIHDSIHQDCGSIWFTYPGSGPSAYVSFSTGEPSKPRPSVQLIKDKKFNEFQKYVDAKMYGRQRDSICTDCTRYEVTAVMIGLVEFAGPGQGFGHMNSFPVQFVLRSIEKTSVKDLAPNYDSADYSTTAIRFATGYVSGTLVGPEGRSISDGDVNIYSTHDPPTHIQEDSATTDEKGRFKFAVPPGNYIIGFNTFWPPSLKAPYPATYYPSSQQRTTAKVVSVVDKQHVNNLVLQLPQPLTARIIPIKVVWPDGKPVAEANVWLSQVSDPTAVVGMSVSHTSADGTFDLTGFEGIDYILHADKYAGLARVSCAKNLLVRSSRSIPARIQLSLTITDFDICKNTDFDVPTETFPPLK